MRHTIHAPILAKIIVAENTLEVVFGIPESNFSFTAGQYVSITLPGLEGERIMDKFHDFSIASSPSYKDSIAIVFRVSKSIFKTALISLPVGAMVTIEGPKGVFTLPEPIPASLVLIAGGVGVAPFLSMMRFAVENQTPYHITFVYFNSTLESTAYRGALDELSRQNNLISVRYILGSVEQKHLIVDGENSKEALYYVAGPPGMVSRVMQELHNLGILDAQVRAEEFTGYE
ncbi:MAG: FAD-dependent oxidoreductase [Patescibacteria group bacterium]